jgi:hypothetical protein
MGDADKVIAVLNRTGPGSTPQDPLAFVARISDSERYALEIGLESAAKPDTKPSDSEIRYRMFIRHSPCHGFPLVLTSRLFGEVYYLLYAEDYEMPSKVAIDPEEPSLGRIRADSVAPPHSPLTIKRSISRVEKTLALAHADLFAKLSSNTPLKERHIISILRTDCPGLSPKEPMVIVLNPSLRDGRYVIKNRAADIYWDARNANTRAIKTWAVHFWPTSIIKEDLTDDHIQVNEHSPIIEVLRG